MIILFGSFARGSWVEDSYVEDGTTYEYKSDYDILVITKTHGKAFNTGIWDKVKKLIRLDKSIKTWTSLIVHDINEFNRKIKKGEYFFCDIKKEGILLYDSKEYKLARTKKLDEKERKKKAEIDFNHWFKTADEFFEFCRIAIDKKYYNKAAFELHQATERFLVATILVFTRYRPKTHDLEKLCHEASAFDKRFLTMFPCKDKKDKDLFELLKRAYIDARYNKAYNITKEELEYLSGCVERLMKLTEEICTGHIKSIR